MKLPYPNTYPLGAGQAGGGLQGVAQPGAPQPAEALDFDCAYGGLSIVYAYFGSAGLLVAYCGLEALEAAYYQLPAVRPDLAGHPALAGVQGILTARAGQPWLQALTPGPQGFPPVTASFPRLAMGYAAYPGLLRAYAGLPFLRAAFGYAPEGIDPTLANHRLAKAAEGEQGLQLATFGFHAMVRAFAELSGRLGRFAVLPGLQPDGGGGAPGPDGGGPPGPDGGGPRGFGGGGLPRWGGRGPRHAGGRGRDFAPRGGNAPAPQGGLGEAGKRAGHTSDGGKRPKRGRQDTRQRSTFEAGALDGIWDDVSASENADGNKNGRSFLIIVMQDPF